MKVILFGATGMVGQGVLRECLLDPGIESVLAVGRNPTREQQPKLREILHNDFTDYSDIVPDHKSPKGMGGGWRDDHPDNIQATHWWCNEEKGSTRTDG